MEKQYAPTMKEKKMNKKQEIKPVETPKAEKVEEKKEEIKTEKKIEDKKEEKKQDKKAVSKKEKAIANGKNLPISPKHSYSICKMIKGRTPEKAIEMLELVAKKKLVVRMNNREVGHRKGKGIMAGRYPVNAALEIKEIVKQLNANSSVNGIENPIIVLAKADRASRPHKREGRRAKRTNLYLEARERTKLNLKKK